MGEVRVDHVAEAIEYAHGVLTGEIPACKWVKAACRRQLDDLERWQNDPAWPYEWRSELADRAIRFIELLPHVKDGNGWRAGELIRLVPAQKFGIACVFGWVRKSNGLRRFRTVYEEVPRKNAKALALDTPIPTTAGWKRMGAVQVGDTLFDERGEPCRVSDVSPVFLGKRCFRVSFSNGSSVVVSEDHLWSVESRSAGYRSRTITTQELAKTVHLRRAEGRVEHNHRITLPRPLRLREAPLRVPPYVLGYWLGNGHHGSGRVTAAEADAPELAEILTGDLGYIARAAGARRGAVNISLSRGHDVPRSEAFTAQLRALGVMEEKQIPPAYLWGSVAQRWALLQGLMDSDGTIFGNKSGVTPRCWYTSVNERLARDVLQLARSLGLKATLRQGEAKLNGVAMGPAWQVSFHAYADQPVFRLRRKKARLPERSARCTRSQRLHVVACEEVSSVPTRCIAVDSPSHLFLAGDGFVPTHNTTKLAPLCLFALTADGEMGAEVYSAATKEEQARIVFDIARQMARLEPEFRARFGLEVFRKALTVRETASAFKPLAADADSLDGLNVSFAAVDELHAHKTRAVYDVLDSGRGSRSQPLLWAITTAGSNRAGVCYDVRSYLTKILNAVLKRHGGLGYPVKGEVTEDETFWGIIYTIDEGDDPFDPKTWRKANPLYGVSVDPDDLQRMAAVAQVQAQALNEFLTKRLNVWVNADAAWMNMLQWDACGDPALRPEDFAGEECIASLDAAFKKDLFAKVRLFRRYQDGAPHFYVFGRYYTNRELVEAKGNEHLQAWAEEGRIRTTPGNVLDIEAVREELLEDTRRFAVVEVPYDPAQLTQFCGELIDQGVPMVEIRPTVLNFSPAMKEVEELVAARRLHHDGDPVLAWAIANVVCHRDAKDNIYPRKDDPLKKIDPAIALFMSMARWIARKEGQSFWQQGGAPE